MIASRLVLLPLAALSLFKELLVADFLIVLHAMTAWTNVTAVHGTTLQVFPVSVGLVLIAEAWLLHTVICTSLNSELLVTFETSSGIDRGSKRSLRFRRCWSLKHRIWRNVPENACIVFRATSNCESRTAV